MEFRRTSREIDAAGTEPVVEEIKSCHHAGSHLVENRIRPGRQAQEALPEPAGPVKCKRSVSAELLERRQGRRSVIGDAESRSFAVPDVSFLGPVIHSNVGTKADIPGEFQFHPEGIGAAVLVAVIVNIAALFSRRRIIPERGDACRCIQP